jgi:hypothetical protein
MELHEKTPRDPDVPKYLSMSEKEVNSIAFFTDEMELALGKVLTGAVFSLPLDTGRLVMKISSLSIFPDSAYGMGAELLAFDRNGRPLWSSKAPYAKFTPLSPVYPAEPRRGIESSLDVPAAALSVLLRSLDRMDKSKQLDPETTGRPPFGGAEILLPISWNDFILLSNVRRGLSGLSPAELLAAAKNLGVCGYPPQIFEAELIRRFAEPLFLLPLGIFAIVVGWRYRALKRPRYMGIPMLGIIPLVVNGLVLFCRGALNEIGTWAVVSLGFATAAIYMGIGIMVLFVLSLILLASQHS